MSTFKIRGFKAQTMDSLQMKCGHIYMLTRLSAIIINYLENGTELLELCTVCELNGML